jgi:carbon monoxide dehydrogenase subunit G
MRLDHSFTVPVPVDEAWKVLLDLPRVAPCMPGASLTGVDGDAFTGTVKVKLGPIGLTYQGKGRFVERDEAAHRVVIEASGRDARAAGTAAATVTATLVAEGEATRVDVATDLTVTGRPAQFGRGMLADVSGKLITQFADCLAETISGPPPAAEPAAAAAAEGQAAQAAPAARAEPADVEPVDLLRVAGSTGAAKRYAGYLGGVLVVGALVWLIIRLLRR